MSTRSTVADHVDAACRVIPERERVRLVPEGELDIWTADGLRARIAELRDVGFCNLVIDLRRLTFMDSRGVHLLLDTDADCRSAGGGLQVIATGSVQRLLDLCRVPLEVSPWPPALAEQRISVSTTGGPSWGG